MTNKDNLLTFFSKNFPFNVEGLEELMSSFTSESYSKGAVILRPSSIDLQLKFVENGFIREYYTSNFNEVNINFYGSDNFATDLNSFLNHTQSFKYQQCLIDVNLRVLSKNKFDQLIAKYSCGQEVISKTFSKMLAAKESLERNRITKTKDELYQELQINKPDWLKHIPQYHIASYLNVTPETLSRIRKRIS